MLDYGPIDMLKFDFLNKGLVIVSTCMIFEEKYLSCYILFKGKFRGGAWDTYPTFLQSFDFLQSL